MYIRTEATFNNVVDEVHSFYYRNHWIDDHEKTNEGLNDAALSIVYDLLESLTEGGDFYLDIPTFANSFVQVSTDVLDKYKDDYALIDTMPVGTSKRRHILILRPSPMYYLFADIATTVEVY